MKVLGNLRPKAGSITAKLRVGRGIGSGFGKTAGKGGKGQTARSGGRKGFRGFEGGQMPLARRLPKFGFTNDNAVPTDEVTTRQLNRFDDGARVTLDLLKEHRLVPQSIHRVKLILKGELNKKLTIQLYKVSAGAAKQVTAKGGTIEPVAVKTVQ